VRRGSVSFTNETKPARPKSGRLTVSVHPERPLRPNRPLAGDGEGMFEFKVTQYRDATAVDLRGFWWYQKQAGLAGVSSKFWRALRFT
jgi:hypothetical protein